jgi:hypothetical protein
VSARVDSTTMADLLTRCGDDRRAAATFSRVVLDFLAGVLGT